MTSLKKSRIPQAKIFFFKCRLEDLLRLLRRVCRAYRTGEILARSHVRLGVFLSENPRILADVKVLKSVDCFRPLCNRYFELTSLLPSDIALL